MKQKLLKIEQVKVDKDVYPRMQVDWVTCARYYNALKSGATFPPITVAKLGTQYLLVDGAHRLKSHKDNKETHIQVEVLEGLDKKGIYLEAVKRNNSHGRQFSTQEVTQICITLEAWNMSEEEISEIVRIPAVDIKPFVAKRMTRISETQEAISLKAPLQNLAGIEVSEDFDQSRISSKSQLQMLDVVTLMLKNGWIDKDSQIIKEKLIKLYELLKPYVTITFEGK